MPDLLDIENVVKDVDKQKAIDKAAVLADAKLSKQIHDCRVYVFKIWSEQCCKFLISLVKIKEPLCFLARKDYKFATRT